MLEGRSRKSIKNSKSKIKKKSKKQERITTKYSNDDKKKRKKKMKEGVKADDGTMDTLSRITQELPRYNWLEEKIRNGENKTPIMARYLQCLTLTSNELKILT